MKRQQLFVRAQSPSGKWHVADVYDLDEPSWRVFLLNLIARSRIGQELEDGFVPGEEVVLRTVSEPVGVD
jgi:hypothetical protein